MTQEMVDLVMPLLGWSITLNFILIGMLLFRPLAKAVGRFLTPYWLGLMLMVRS